MRQGLGSTTRGILSRTLRLSENSSSRYHARCIGTVANDSDQLNKMRRLLTEYVSDNSMSVQGKCPNLQDNVCWINE